MLNALRSTLFVSAVLLATAVVAQPAQQIAILRVESLDALMADVETVLRAVGEEPEAPTAELLQPMLASVGIPDSSWVDSTRPFVAVYPTEGMMLGAQGLVGAFPIKDPDAALQALTQAFEGHGYDDEVHTFFGQDESRVFVVSRERYLVAGGNRDLALDFDLEAVLDLSDLPPGNIALDIHLEPLMPLIQMGMTAGRQALAEEYAEEDEDADPQVAMDLMDFYFRLVQDLVANTARLQISAEVTSEQIILHKRLIPRSGSTLAGLLEAQRGKGPDLGRRLDASNFAIAVVGGVEPTPAFLEALKEYARAYVGIAGTFAGELEEDEAFLLNAFMGPMGKMLEEWIDCYRGDFAGVFEFADGGGMRVVQLAGIGDREKCEAVLEKTVEVVNELPRDPEGRRFMTITEDALVHRGVSAMRQETRLMLPEGEEAQEASEALDRWFGSNVLVAYTAMTDELFVSATGNPAEQVFKDAMDRLRRKKARGGLLPDLFQPIEFGPGYFLVFDVERLGAAMVPLVDAEEAAELQFLVDLPEGAEKLVWGARLERDSLQLEATLPLKLLEAAALAEEAAEAAATEQKQAPAEVEGPAADSAPPTPEGH